MWQFYSEPKELYHHGIKGQKWGKRNGPPYPLSEKKHNAVVKSAKSTDLKSQKSGIIDPATAVVATYALAALTSLGINKIREMRTRKADAKKDAGHEIDSLDSLEKLRTLKTPQTAEAIAKKVNPEFDENDPSTSTNCPYCTLATELRYRGYDVSAKHLSTGDNIYKLYNKTFKTPPPIDWSEEKSYNIRKGEMESAYIKRRNQELCADIAKKSGPNSRGAISYFVPGFYMGHVFNYTVDSRGKVRFIDGQNGNANADSNIDSLPDYALINFARLDNRAIASRMTDTIRTP